MAATVSALPTAYRPPVAAGEVRAVAGGGVNVDFETGEIEGAPLSKLTTWYRSYQDSKLPEMDEQRLSRRYYHASQWTEEEERVLRERGQPIITVNRLARKIDGMVGIIERLRQDPKAFPRTPAHAAGADLATAVLRYVFDQNRWSDTANHVAHDMAVSGLGGVEFDYEETEDEGSRDVTIHRVAPETFFYDPRSVRPDFKDARFMGVAKWMDFDAAAELFPDKRDILRQVMNTYGREGDAQGLRDWEKNWYDTRLDRVLIVQISYKWNGQWYECIHTGHLKLAGGPSGFVDGKGKSTSRYVMASANVDHDGDRYGFVRNLKGPQDEVNHRRSALLHAIHSNRVIADQDAVADVEDAKKQLARRDGWVEKQRGTELEVIPPAIQMQGQAELLQEAKLEIENFGGANPALAGGQGQENRSGRAIALMQQAAMAELGPYVVTFRGWKLACYRMAWNAVRTAWTTQRYIRITDNPDEIQFVMLNQPVMTPYGVPAVGPDGQPLLANAIGQLDVDIILDEGPDTITLREDLLSELKDMVVSKIIPPQAYVEAATFPPDIKAMLKKYVEPEASPEQQMQQQLMLANAAAEVRKKNASAAKDEAATSETLASAHAGHMANLVATGMHNHAAAALGGGPVEGPPLEPEAGPPVGLAGGGAGPVPGPAIGSGPTQPAPMAGLRPQVPIPPAGPPVEGPRINMGQRAPMISQDQMLAQQAAQVGNAMKAMQQLSALIAAPKRVVYDEEGRMVGLETVTGR